MSQHARLVRLSLCAKIILCGTLAPLTGQPAVEKKPANALKPMEVDVGGSVKMKLVYIEPGKFLMGSPREELDRYPDEIQHEVQITKGFYMGVFEVTQEEYAKVVGDNPSLAKGERLPVEFVTWQDATEFCKRLSKHAGKTFDLPTEAEWEYACRAGSKGAFHFGKTLSAKQANIDEDLGKSVRVGSYEPNALGLYDMHGNVFEWCKDWHKEDYYKEAPVQDPKGPVTEKKRVLRGGGYSVPAKFCRSAHRYALSPDGKAPNVGFRVVMRLP